MRTAHRCEGSHRVGSLSTSETGAEPMSAHTSVHNKITKWRAWDEHSWETNPV